MLLTVSGMPEYLVLSKVFFDLKTFTHHAILSSKNRKMQKIRFALKL